MKKIALLLTVTLLMIGVCGCMGTSNSKIEKDAIKRIESYLGEKYKADFTYISEGDEDWLSKSRSYVFADANKRSLVVRDNNGHLADNYSSALYDSVASEGITGAFVEDAKLFINTESSFFGSDQKFTEYSDYLRECPVLNIAIYVPGTCDYDGIANCLKDLLVDCCASVVVYSVDANSYVTISENDRKVAVLSSESFWLEDNHLSEKSWEE